MRSFHRKDRKDDPNSTKKNSSATNPSPPQPRFYRRPRRSETRFTL